MPRRPDPANLEHPIRKLRQQLGLTQDRLAEKLGLSGDDIRNLENGRQKMPAHLFKRIITALGAEYSTRKKQWILVNSTQPCSPVTLAAWRQSSRPNARLKRKDHEALSYRVAALLAHAQPSEYHMVFMKVSKALEDCLEQYQNPKAKAQAREEFKRSADRMQIRTSGAEVEFDPDRSEVVGQPAWVSAKETRFLEVTRTYDELPPATDLLLPEQDLGSGRSEPPTSKPQRRPLSRKAVQAIMAILEKTTPEKDAVSAVDNLGDLWPSTPPTFS